MAVPVVLALLVQSLFQYPQAVGDGWEDDARLRMERRAQELQHQMARLLPELEQGPQEGSVSAWPALPGAALQHWHLWAPAAVLLLLLGLRWGCRRVAQRRRAAASRGAQQEALRSGREQPGEKEELTKTKETADGKKEESTPMPGRKSMVLRGRSDSVRRQLYPAPAAPCLPSPELLPGEKPRQLCQSHREASHTQRVGLPPKRRCCNY